MLKVICNYSPIIHLNKIGYIHLLELLYKRIYVTGCVFEECTGSAFQSPEIAAEIETIKKASFIEISPIKNHELFLAFSKLVDEGEASAISLALEEKADLILLDDFEARELAQVYNLNYTGTIGILLKARKKDLIRQSIPDIIDNLKRTGFYLSTKMEKYILENS
jgi:predicted nucleic acid-binding protein